MMPSVWKLKGRERPVNADGQMIGNLEWAWLETGGVCVYCNRAHGPEARSIDHIVPRSLGGHNHILNYCAACKRCNFNRGLKMPASRHAHPKWRGLIRAREQAMENQMRANVEKQRLLNASPSQAPTAEQPEPQS